MDDAANSLVVNSIRMHKRANASAQKKKCLTCAEEDSMDDAADLLLVDSIRMRKRAHAHKVSWLQERDTERWQPVAPCTCQL